MGEQDYHEPQMVQDQERERAQTALDIAMNNMMAEYVAMREHEHKMDAAKRRFELAQRIADDVASEMVRDGVLKKDGQFSHKTEYGSASVWCASRTAIVVPVLSTGVE